jgi:hypothetical protein
VHDGQVKIDFPAPHTATNDERASAALARVMLIPESLKFSAATEIVANHTYSSPLYSRALFGDIPSLNALSYLPNFLEPKVQSQLHWIRRARHTKDLVQLWFKCE